MLHPLLLLLLVGLCSTCSAVEKLTISQYREATVQWKRSNSSKISPQRKHRRFPSAVFNLSPMETTRRVGFNASNNSNFTIAIQKKKKKLNSTINYCFNRRYRRTAKSGINWAKELVTMADRLSRKSSIVVTGGDWAYRATVLNWMAHADNIGMTEYIVLCYGESMLKLVGSWQDGGHGLLVKDCVRVIEFMFMKIVAMHHLHSHGLIVTWSDCDALWLRPIVDDWILPYKNKVDLLAQKALHPVGISNITGSVICTGLFTVFPSERAAQAMKLLVRAVRSYRIASDQLLVNKYLARVGVFAFAEYVKYDDIDGEQRVFIPTYENASFPKLGFLPSGVFPRSRSDQEWGRIQLHDPALWHSKTDKVGQSKIDGMKNSSVFALKDGWEGLTDASQVAAFVDKDLLLSKRWKAAAGRIL